MQTNSRANSSIELATLLLRWSIYILPSMIHFEGHHIESTYFILGEIYRKDDIFLLDIDYPGYL